jgi:hypothetical protein
MRRLIRICIICSSMFVAGATLATPSIAGGTSGASSSVKFTVSAPQSPLNVLVIMLPGGLKFDSRNQFKIISKSRYNLIEDVDYYPDRDNDPSNPNAKFILGPATYSACKAAGAQCLIVEFNAPGFGPSDSLTFSQGILKGSTPATLQQLAGANITFALNLPGTAGSTTTGQFITTSELEFNSTTGQDTASTQTASTTVPPTVTNPGSIAPSGGPGCTPFINNFGFVVCSDPVQGGIADGNACAEGGQSDQDPLPRICP